jgi:ADP-ribose pyrophosphatase
MRRGKAQQRNPKSSGGVRAQDRYAIESFFATKSKDTQVATKKNQARIISSKIAFQSNIFSVRHESVVEPGGLKVTRDVVTHPGSVVVLPVFPDGRILMIRQYRHAAKQFLWELVAGRKDAGENFVQGAHRELREETGYTARQMTKMLDLFPSPGFISENMVIFLAEGLRRGEAHPEEDEKITQRIFALKEAKSWIRSGKIRDAKSVAGILYFSMLIAKNNR